MQNSQITQAQMNLVPVSRQAATEGIVLLKNEQQALPLMAQDTVSLFGRCQINTYRSGTGSGGAVNVPYAISALDGIASNPAISYNQELAQLYRNWVADHPFDDGGGGWAAEPWFQQEMPLSDELVSTAAQQSNKAIVFIGRTAGEDQDNQDLPGSYRLTELEQQILTLVCRHFECVIVVMNVTNIIDMSWLEMIQGSQSIKAVMYSWAAGMEAGDALADVLSGAESPSGRLSDTIAYRIEDYPSTRNFGDRKRNVYQEDIYVGYRYFETFAPEKVQFEFGAGLSYSDFRQDLVGYRVEGQGSETQLLFEIEVTNTGSVHAGKEVVQLYVEAPQGLLGKPRRTLVAFAKTRKLAAKQSQLMTINLPLSQLASYDDSGVTGNRNCYLLEAGEYNFYLGGSVRQAKPIDACFSLEELVVTERLQEACAPILPFERMKPTSPDEQGYFQLGFESVPQRTVDMATRISTNMPDELKYIGDVGLKLADVKSGQASLETFVAQMTVEQMATLVCGEGMCSPKVTPGTAAAFGGVSDSLFQLGIPVAAAADGPSGIRMDSGHKATQVPIGTLLGCTWNSELNEQLFYLIGQELHANHIDTLLGPGINIHRHPLNGRNFEYFSEDPYLTGMIASAQTRGLSRAGVSGTIKHFAANDQETARVDVDSIISQRAIREVHVKPFEMAVKQGRASTIMTSYNPVNGHWAASNYDLNTTLLRNEWGFSGIVMTDWWAKMNDPISGGVEAKTFTSHMLKAQNDLYMVVENDGAENNAMQDDTLEAIESGRLTLAELQRSAMNICRFILATPVMARPLQAYQPVKSFKSKALPPSEAIYSAISAIEVNASTNLVFDIEIEVEGIYHCQGLMSYDRDSLAQSSCSMAINDQFAMSFPVHGTEGKSVLVDGLKIQLERGTYTISVDFVKAGALLEMLYFKRQ
ncbi:glycoside hydrolase family 3 C-terminal domain-containing protein [Vibrio brasiliensis]|uniref:glycoside hydrolase family 3 protein n=1 Tax=Vibrio brasiliensis TaxID=170652 RepID=UPI001EFD3443|nr:glycoside hydrolase family 3 protein [Vibrio brasiliensis]MCG9752247.1 glycoside hydrolase family 3 C-terminal domain-containing protein [Vibrio brasiliensis]